MGTNCAPPITDLFLYLNEPQYMVILRKDPSKHELISTLRAMTSCFVNICNILDFYERIINLLITGKRLHQGYPIIY